MGPANAISNTRSSAPSKLGFLAALPLSLFLFSLWSLLTLDDARRIVLPWVPSLGVDLTLHVDGLALQMILLITGVGSGVFLYAAGYMKAEPRRVRFFVLLTIFMIAMLGAVSTDNLLALFAFWEMTSITSFLLVGFKHEYESSRKSAQQALLVTASGGLALLAGVTLLGQIAGTYSIQEVLATHESWRDHPLLTSALFCVFFGSIHQIRAVSLSFLASRRNGRPDASQCLPAFCHDGEARDLPPGAPRRGIRYHSILGVLAHHLRRAHISLGSIANTA